MDQCHKTLELEKSHEDKLSQFMKVRDRMVIENHKPLIFYSLKCVVKNKAIHKYAKPKLLCFTYFGTFNIQ